MISYGGLLKGVHKELNLDEVEDGDLVHVDVKRTKYKRSLFCCSFRKAKLFLLA